MFTFERALLTIVGGVGLYLVWGPMPVGEPGRPGFGLRWGMFDYYEPEYAVIRSHFDAERCAAAAAALRRDWTPGRPTGLCGTAFVEITYEPRGGIDPPMLACSATVTLLGLASAWLCLRPRS